MRVALASTLSRAACGVVIALLAAAVCGCASGPGRAPPRASGVEAGALRGSDGPGIDPPADLASRPDAEPRIEPIRPGGANKPYQVLGRSYVPQTSDAPFRERGLASWYGRKFHGRMTASGETYDMYAMTAAHPTLPIPSYARIRNPANGREVLVRINDRGPFVEGRIVDLSYTAALKLDLLRGVAPVELERITFDDIRTGAWRRGAPVDVGDGAASRLASAAGKPAALKESAAPAMVVPTRDVTLVADSQSQVPNQTTAPTPSSVQADAAPLASPAASEQAASSRLLPARIDERRRDDSAQPLPRSTIGETARGFWIQLGAFRQRGGADAFRRRVGADVAAGWLDPLLTIVAENALFRVQAGPYASRDDADVAAARAQAALAIVPIVVERR